MSEVNNSISTPIQTPTDPMEINIVAKPVSENVSKPISPPIPSPKASGEMETIKSEEHDGQVDEAVDVPAVEMLTESVKHDLEDKTDNTESTKRAKADEAADSSVSQLPTSEPTTSQLQNQESSQTQATEINITSIEQSASVSDTSQMTPAPKPPAEPDMSNLPENPIPKHQQQFGLRILKIIKRMKDAGPFLHPVDIEKLKIPLYYNFIKRPMDLSTMERKLNVNAYDDVSFLTEDFNLMVSNCIRFNGAESAIAQMARNIQASFEKHMLNMPSKELPPSTKTTTSGRKRISQTPGELNSEGVPTIRRDSASLNGRPKREIHPPKPKDMPYDIRPRKKKFVPELRFSQHVLKELASKKYESFNYPFLEPVDPVALNCPTYFDYVKKPMDFSTIQNKLNNNQYENADEFESDIRLVFKNCYIFNPEGTAVNMMGHRLEAIFDKKWLDRPQTPQTPNQSDDEYTSDDESDEEPIDEASVTSPAIQFLEEQLERMQQQLAKLRKEEIEKMKKERGLKKKGKKAKKRRRKTSGGSSIISYEMKKELSERINELSEKKLNQVLTIISESLNLNNQGEEIELDMDQLDNATLLKLYNFVVKKKSTSKRSNAKQNVVVKKTKKSKNLSEAEQNRQIESIKKKIELFDQSGNDSPFANNDNDSDDDSDDVSSESSEEE